MEPLDPCNTAQGNTVTQVLRAQRQVDPKDLLARQSSQGAMLQVQWETMPETTK